MTCRREIWKDSPMLEAVRESSRSGRPLEWIRVHDLPDFVYFDHSIHVAKGVGCASCHGRVDDMPLTWREATLHMDWCLDCHRHPARHVRRRGRVCVTPWHPLAVQQAEGRALVKEYGIM